MLKYLLMPYKLLMFWSLAFLFLQANAQNFPVPSRDWAPVGAEWYFEYQVAEGSVSYAHMVSSGDSVYLGKNCRLLKMYTTRPDLSVFDSDTLNMFTYIENNKIFISYENDTVFYIWFDISIQASQNNHFDIPYSYLISYPCYGWTSGINDTIYDCENIDTITNHSLLDTFIDFNINNIYTHNHMGYLVKSQITRVKDLYMADSMNKKYFIFDPLVGPGFIVYPDFSIYEPQNGIIPLLIGELTCYFDPSGWQYGYKVSEIEGTPANFGCNSTAVIARDENIEENFSINPNPTHSLLTFQLKTTIIENINIYDFSGRLVETELIPSGISEFIIDVSSWPCGVYVARSGEWAARFVVAR